MEILMEGMLYIQAVRFGKKTWRKTWGVLHNPSSKGVGRLELYSIVNNNAVSNQKKWSRLKTPESKTVRLSDCLSVSTAPKESCPDGCSAFYLHTRQCIYTLASLPDQDWLSCLCPLVFQSDSEDSDLGSSERGTGLIMKDNDLYCSWTTESNLPPNTYRVTVQSTEASRRCNLSGTYLFSPEPEAVTLLTCNSGHVLYTWSYRQMRRLKQVEGGFSFEARRGCQSGNGVFVFLSARAPEILQTILEQCSVQTSTSVPPLTDNHKSLCDQFPTVVQTVTHPPAAPAVYAPEDDPAETEHGSDNIYSNINLRPRPQPSLSTPSISISTEAVGDESENDDNDQCYYLSALSLDDHRDGSDFFDLRRTISAPTEEDASQCVYSAVKKTKSSMEPQVETFYSPLPPPPPCPPPQPVSYTPYPKPRYQHQLSVNNLIQPGLSTQAQAVDDIKEMEEAISSSTHVTPTEPPGSFKYRLAAIISKDLAKSQPDPHPTVSGSTLSW